MFDTSKKEMLNPNQGFKKFVMKLKQRYTVSGNISKKNGFLSAIELLFFLALALAGINLDLILQCTVNKQEIDQETLNGQ